MTSPRRTGLKAIYLKKGSYPDLSDLGSEESHRLSFFDHAPLSLPPGDGKRRDYVYMGSLGKLANSWQMAFLSGSPTTDKTENDRINTVILVDEMGFEPTTSSLRTVGKIS
jgi:hypothetical protein